MPLHVLGRRLRRVRGPIVFRWDLDKTYLKSDFDSLREMVKIPFERAEDKVAAPGVIALIRALREVAVREGREVQVCFLSASPPQIGREIRKKLELDGIVYDGIVFKNQLQRLMRGKFRHLREQVGYKLTELLKARACAPPGAREVLFGDDWESDPLIYSLYADVLAGAIGSTELAEILTAVGVDPPLVEDALALASEVPRGEAVERIYINLERRTPPAAFYPFGRRLVPTFNYLQTAASLFADGLLDVPAVVTVARSLVGESGYTPGRLGNSLADIRRRGALDPAAEKLVCAALAAGGLTAGRRRLAVATWMLRWRNQCALWVATCRGRQRDRRAIDYRSLVAPPGGEGSHG